MAPDRSRLWFAFESYQSALSPTGLDPRSLGLFGSVALASYTYTKGVLIVWVDEIQDPSASVMFLVSQLRPRFGSPHPANGGIWPHYIITDGDRWCPLIKGNDRIYRSYPTGYTGILLGQTDRQVIRTWLAMYVEQLNNG